MIFGVIFGPFRIHFGRKFAYKNVLKILLFFSLIFDGFLSKNGAEREAKGTPKSQHFVIIWGGGLQVPPSPPRTHPPGAIWSQKWSQKEPKIDPKRI